MKKSLLYILLLVSGLLTSCYPGSEDFGFVMDVQTMEVTPQVLETNLSGSYMVVRGNPSVTEVGFCWKKREYSYDNALTIENNVLKAEGVSETFSAVLTGLESSETYLVCSYVKVDETYVYGPIESFHMPYFGSYLPSVKEVTVSYVHNTQAQLSAPVTVPDANLPVTEAGFEYSKDNINDYNPNATKPTRVKGTLVNGVVTCDLTGLETGKTYYVRAYAINKLGVQSGIVSNFTTLNSAPEMSEPGISNLLLTSVDLNAVVTPYNGNSVTEAGFQYERSYSNLTNYSTSLRGVMNGNTVTLSMTSLSKATAYQARVYAKTALGTFYGPICNFKTLGDADLPSVLYRGFSLTQDDGTFMTDIALKGFAQSLNAVFPITEVGFLYKGSDSNYTTLDFTTNDASREVCSLSNGIFNANINVSAYKSYSYILVRAYAFSGKQVVYNSETIKLYSRVSSYTPKLNTLSYTKLSSVNGTVNLSLSGSIEDSYGLPVTEYGFVCSSTTYAPTVESNEKMVKLTSGSFVGVINVPRPGSGTKTYNVRAYAKNKYGIAYSTYETISVRYDD